MALCLFATDLHGHKSRYEKLFAAIRRQRPDAVFLGGDLLPNHLAQSTAEAAEQLSFVDNTMGRGFDELRQELGENYPRVFVILGNDDGQGPEEDLRRHEKGGLWEYIHGRKVDLGGITVYGYCFAPPTPFQLKDWERYDVSRYTPPGCISPEEGRTSYPVDVRHVRYATIKDDLKELTANDDVSASIFLFHSPPHETNLDRAALDGKSIDHVPLDLHVGSIAIRRFLEKKKPRISLHGHIHESARIMGSWKDRVGETWCFGAAHDGPELSLIRFDSENPQDASRELL